MGCSPLGVAMSVFGAVHTHWAQPSGQVPLSVAGVQAVQEAPAFTLQHSSPALQHSASQQVVVPAHVTPWQGALSHLPLLQNGPGPGQTVPQAPQLLMSLPVLVHSGPQHLKPQLAPHVEPPAPAAEPPDPPAPATAPPNPPAPPPVTPAVPPRPAMAPMPALPPEAPLCPAAPPLAPP